MSELNIYSNILVHIRIVGVLIGPDILKLKILVAFQAKIQPIFSIFACFKYIYVPKMVSLKALLPIATLERRLSVQECFIWPNTEKNEKKTHKIGKKISGRIESVPSHANFHLFCPFLTL